MFNIYESSTNILAIPLKEYETLINPYYIFQWVDTYNRKNTFSLVNTSVSGGYHKFYFTDGSEGRLLSGGTVNIYESPYDASVIDGSMNLLTNELYKYIVTPFTHSIYDISINLIHNVYDPSVA